MYLGHDEDYTSKIWNVRIFKHKESCVDFIEYCVFLSAVFTSNLFLFFWVNHAQLSSSLENHLEWYFFVCKNYCKLLGMSTYGIKYRVFVGWKFYSFRSPKLYFWRTEFHSHRSHLHRCFISFCLLCLLLILFTHR